VIYRELRVVGAAHKTWARSNSRKV